MTNAKEALDYQALIECWALVASQDSWEALTAQYSILRPFGGRGPQAGYVGEGYRPGGCLFLGQNPRLTDSQKGHKTGDDELYRYQAILVKKGDRESFDNLMQFQRKFMQSWEIFRAIEFPDSFGLDWSEVAYINSCQCPTAGNKFHKKTWLACCQEFLSKQLAVLKPARAIFFGKAASDLADDLCPGLVTDWLPHPTGTYSKVNPEVMNEQLSKCRKLASG